MPLRSLPLPALSLSGLVLSGLLLGAGVLPAAAQTTMESREAVYLDYYRAVAAHERCRKVKLPEEAHAAIARYAERQGASEIGTKRLQLIQQAKRDVRAAGCHSPLATEALARFDRELQSQVP